MNSLDWRSVLAPEAPSTPLAPLVFEGIEKLPDGDSYEQWANDRYYISVRRYRSGFTIRNSPHIQIGITSIDETARHDWRDFQAIKNQIAGPEWEGVELYPAESRLKDPSNRFYLWCVPKGILKWGLPGGRLVLKASEALAPQRPFPEEAP